MTDVRDLRAHDLGGLAAGIEEELIDLVGADVAQDAAVLDIVVEPRRPTTEPSAVQAGALVDLMRRDVDGLDHFPDGALADEFARVHRGLHLEPFAVENSVDPFRLLDRLAD